MVMQLMICMTWRRADISELVLNNQHDRSRLSERHSRTRTIPIELSVLVPIRRIGWSDAHFIQLDTVGLRSVPLGEMRGQGSQVDMNDTFEYIYVFCGKSFICVLALCEKSEPNIVG